jgi:hypothetical protein
MSYARKRRPALRQVGMAVLVAAVGLLCALVVAGCGSSSPTAASTTSSTASTTASTTTTTGTSTTSASQAAFQSCLQKNGATLPAGGGFGGGGGGGAGVGGGGQPGAAGGNRPAPSAALQKALTACASLRPAGGFGGRGGGGARPAGGGATNSNNRAFAKFQSCLKAHGVTGTNSPNSASAIAACRSDLPNGGNQTPAGSTTTTPAA